jgi:hypothetical protein
VSRHDELWQQLSDAGIVRGDAPALDAPSPWYVRAMLGAGGWLAAGFLLSFVGAIFTFVFESVGAALVVGALVIAGATALFVTVPKNTFVNQLGLAAAFAGQVMVLYGFFESLDSTTGRMLVVAAFEAMLAMVVPHPVHRVFAAAAAGIALSAALAYSGAYYLAAGVLAAIVASFWLTESEWLDYASTLRPIAYGLTLAFIFIQATWLGQQALSELLSGGTVEWVPRWAGSTLPAAVLAGTVIRLLQRGGRPLSDRDSIAAIVATLAVCAASFDAPGVPSALMLVLVGFGQGNRSLVGLGAFGLMGYVSAYYYLLDTTLLQKSFAMVVTGAVLLVARAILVAWSDVEEEATEASGA